MGEHAGGTRPAPRRGLRLQADPARGRSRWLPLAGGVLALAVLLAAGAALVRWMLQMSALEAALWLGLLAGLVGGFALREQHAAFARVTARLWRGMVVLGLGLMLLGGVLSAFRWWADITLQVLPVSLQAVTLVAWGVLLATGLAMVAVERLRIRTFDTLRRIGIMAPIGYSIGLTWIAILFFGTLSALLHDEGVADYAARGRAPEPGTVTLGMLLDFYLWHFADAIPALRVPDTLDWQVPVEHRGAAAGWLLLAFKLTVIVPVLSAFVAYWRRQTSAAHRHVE